MKLIIGGATGFVGKEILNQALANPTITSIVTIGRRSLGSNASPNPKVTELILEDLATYPPTALEQIANADACIWTIAIAFRKAQTTPFEEVKKVTWDYTLAGLEALTSENKTGKPLRFIYFSGVAASRDPEFDYKGPEGLEAYVRLRGKIEVALVDHAAQNKDRVEVCCVRPGYIEGDRGAGYVAPEVPAWLPKIKLDECVAAVLNQSIAGIQQDPLGNAEMVEIGQRALAAQNQSQ